MGKKKSKNRAKQNRARSDPPPQQQEAPGVAIATPEPPSITDTTSAAPTTTTTTKLDSEEPVVAAANEEEEEKEPSVSAEESAGEVDVDEYFAAISKEKLEDSVVSDPVPTQAPSTVADSEPAPSQEPEDPPASSSSPAVVEQESEPQETEEEELPVQEAALPDPVVEPVEPVAPVAPTEVKEEEAPPAPPVVEPVQEEKPPETENKPVTPTEEEPEPAPAPAPTAPVTEEVTPVDLQEPVPTTPASDQSSTRVSTPEEARKVVIMSTARVTLEHLEIIHKYVGDDSPDKAQAVADMHNELKAADGGLADLKSSQYSFTVNPLKEAIWFEQKGQFAIGCASDWTLCKTFMTTKKCISSLTNNLGLLDLDDLPGDDSVFSIKKFGNKLTDDEANDWFHNTLEALYELVDMDSTGAIDVGRRDELLQVVASFVHIGSRTCFESGTPAPKPTGLPAPQRFGFSVILRVFAKLKEVGAKDLDSVDWESMNIPAEDGIALWQSLSKRAKEGLPQSVWWKVLFLLVEEFEPHLLRMNLHLLDKAEVTSFQTFLDECMEPPELANNRFYKKMIQQVLSLQKICLLTTPPRRNMSPLTQLDKAFEIGAEEVYDPKVVEAMSPAAAPAPPPVIDVPVEAAPAPVPLEQAPAPAPISSPVPAPSLPVAVAPASAPGAGPPQLPTLAQAGVKTAPPPAAAVKSPAVNTGGRPPRSPRAPPRDIPIEIKTDLPAVRAGDHGSVSGSLVELNKEENLLDLMQQAAVMCENITSEKRELILRERRMARNLKSAEDNLKAVQAINAQLLAENSSQKEEIYQREDDINQLHMEAKHAAKELSTLDTQNSQLLEQIEDLTRTIASLTADKAGLEEELQQSKDETASVQGALEIANQEKAALETDIASERATKAVVEQDLAKMQQDKDTVELKLKEMQALLESANDEIDRLEEIQAEQQRLEAEARKAAMEARRREFEAAEREAEESQRKAEEMSKAKSAARRRSRMVE